MSCQLQRGVCPFVDKALRAQEAGAVGVIFINSTDEVFVPMRSNTAADDAVVIPCVCISRADFPLLRTEPAISFDFDVSTNADGAGTAPAATPISYENLFEAQYDWPCENAGDLGLSKGALVEVTDQTAPGSGWWTGRLQADPPGATGIFPSNYVVPLSAERLDALRAKASRGAPPPRHVCSLPFSALRACVSWAVSPDGRGA